MAEPVSRFASGERTGSAEEEVLARGRTSPGDLGRVATLLRTVLRAEK